jgi:hypothetical protein
VVEGVLAESLSPLTAGELAQLDGLLRKLID